MPLPTNHTLNTDFVTTYSPSVGGTPQACYVRAPFRSRLLGYSMILRGPITTADGTITVAVNGTTVGTFTITQSGSAAGQLFTGTPASPVYMNSDDVISFTPSGASGTTIGGDFQAIVRRA